MWRIIATLCLTVGAEYTPQELDEMSSSIQATADKLQSKVVELSKQITPLSMKINKFPVQALTASDAEKAKLEEAIKLDLTQMCNILDSLSKVQGDVEKDSADSKDTVAKIMAQVTDMAGDPEKLSDAPTMQHYLSKIQKAIGTLDSAATSAATYMGIKGMCEKDTQEAATRLFLQTGPVTGLVKFHLPSALLGAVAATVLGAAFVIFRAKSARSSVALMEEGSLE